MALMESLAYMTKWLLGGREVAKEPDRTKLAQHDTSKYTAPKDHVFSWPKAAEMLRIDMKLDERGIPVVDEPEVFEFPPLPAHIVDGSPRIRKVALAFIQEVMAGVVAMKQECIRRDLKLDEEMLQEIRDLAKRQDKALKRLGKSPEAVEGTAEIIPVGTEDSEEKIIVKFKQLRQQLDRDFSNRKRQNWIDALQLFKVVASIQLKERHIIAREAVLSKNAEEEQARKKSMQRRRKADEKDFKKNMKEELKGEKDKFVRQNSSVEKKDLFNVQLKTREGDEIKDMQKKHEQRLQEIVEETKEWAQKLASYYDDQIAVLEGRKVDGKIRHKNKKG